MWREGGRDEMTLLAEARESPEEEASRPRAVWWWWWLLLGSGGRGKWVVEGRRATEEGALLLFGKGVAVQRRGVRMRKHDSCVRGIDQDHLIATISLRPCGVYFSKLGLRWKSEVSLLLRVRIIEK